MPDPGSGVRFLHVVATLDTGGAERALARIVSVGERGHGVLVLRGGGAVTEDILEQGIPLIDVGLDGLRWFPLRLVTLLRAVRRTRPEVLVGWMYHGNLAATLAGALCRVPVVWNIRHSLHDLRLERPLVRASVRIGAALSRTPRRIVYNSAIAARQHAALGFRERDPVVIPNGFEVSTYRPDCDARARVRAELGISGDAVVVGHVARLHPMKDHLGFIEAIRRLGPASERVHCVMVGRGVDAAHTGLRAALSDAQLNGRVHLLGERRDLPAVMSALDVFVLSSAWGEGFPNVVAEAMSCGVPAVVTDTGDAPMVVGETGRVVPRCDYEAMARAVADLLVLAPEQRAVLGAKARNRIVELYDLARIAPLYHEAFDVAGFPRRERAARGASTR